MNSTVIVSLVSLTGTLIGTFGGIMAANRLTTYRLSQLEKKVEKHNSVNDRTYKHECRITEAEHDIRDIKNKI